MELLSKNGIPLSAAHRGVSGGNIPCNSLAAYKAALAQGADIIELDVTVSRDGQLFTFHPGMEPAHLNIKRFIRTMSAKSAEKLLYVNQDDTKTVEKVQYLDDVFAFLKGKCLINVDKFWTAPEKITECIRKHGIEEQVIIKTSPQASRINDVERYAPDLAFMPIVKNTDDITKELMNRKINLVGVEACFDSDTAQVASDEYILRLHENGLAIWGNAIVYDYKDVISGGHTDDISVCGEPEKGWGWFRDKKFDIVQTDWLLAMNTYYGK